MEKKKMEKKKPVVVYLTKDLHHKLRYEALEKETNVTQLLIKILEERYKKGDEKNEA